MVWEAVDTIPFRVGADITPARAHAIGDALLRRAVPLARLCCGRLEPLATGSLVSDGEQVALLTAAHIFDQASVGDLAVPLPRQRRILTLGAARLRVLVHPRLDLVLLGVGDRVMAEQLLANWIAFPLRRWCSGTAPSETYVLAGYPSANARRCDGRVHMKPIVLFTRSLETEAGAGHYAYARTALRMDGLEIHTPELDGVSGATLWAVEDALPAGINCVLRPVAVQVAFRHGRHVRAEPISGAAELLAMAG